jgi:hypothetical protein
VKQAAYIDDHFKLSRLEIFSRKFLSRLCHSFSCTFPTLEAHAPGSVRTFRSSDTETETHTPLHDCLGMTAHHPAPPKTMLPLLYRIRIQHSLLFGSRIALIIWMAKDSCSGLPHPECPPLPVCETNFQGELSTSFSGGYWEGHRAAAVGGLWRNRIFLITWPFAFPLEFDVWGRLCTHCGVAKVMTFAPVTQHFSH